jgi:crotonobetainyl-CoA:carnitine CoA-transferase CaiB-like acyl-CoA transferase
VSGAQPLAGVRVLDLCVILSGPFATEILADLGAEVIKIESRQHYPDTTKGPRHFSAKAALNMTNTLRGFVDGDPGKRPWDRAARVNVVGRNKLSVTVDLERSEGLDVFLDLVKVADVVIENNSPKLLPKLGIDWKVLHAINPKLILVRMPALGTEGVDALAGVGSNFEAMIGFASFRGYANNDRRKIQPTFRMDAASGPAAALATMAALRRVRRGGDGVEIVLNQTANLLHHSADVLIEAQLANADPMPPENSHPRMVPHGCYPTRGEDRWLVLACRDDADWQKLKNAMGSPSWCRDEFDTFENRLAARESIDDEITKWTLEQDDFEAEELLVGAGVPAAAVRTESEKFADGYFVDRDWFLTMDHPEAGVRRYQGHLWRSSAGALASHRSSPTLGQDNDYVYRDVLGYSDERIEALKAAGHIGTTYTFEDATE